MSAETTAIDGAQAATGSEPQAGGASAPAAGEAATLSADELKAELARVRREAAGHRAENTRLKGLQEAADAAKLSDLERAQAERDTAKAELEAERLERRAAINRYEVQIKAAALGIVSPDAAVKLLDWESIEYAEDGSPKDIEAALKSLLKTYPFLAGTAAGGSAPMNPASNRSGAGTPITRAQLATMTPQQIQTAMARGQLAHLLAGKS